jgi:alpha-tubulin suppressor-like RCC1 family protein
MKNKRFFWIMIFCLILIALNACNRGNDSPSTIVTAISAGNSHTVALKNDGTLLAWGYNAYGQLGDGTMMNRYAPTPVPVGVTLLTGITAISAGGYRTVAIKNDGTIWAWGYNISGELGDGTTTNRYTPVQISDLTGITAISAGDLHTVALRNDGTFWVWGNNYYGQLGDGTNINRNIPAPVSGLTDIIAISAGVFNTVALKNDHTVLAWGLNSSGQLGDGTTDESHIPVQVGGGSLLTDVIAISVGESHAVALKTDGTVWAWGLNSSGQLGEGTTTNSYTPVQVKAR